MELREIQYRDRVQSKISIFKADTNNGVSLICLPALGVRASYYEVFASALSNQGYNVITTDHRGHGHSSVRPSSSINFGYQELIDDAGEIVDHAAALFPNTKKIIIGHSLGGQIGSLYTAQSSNKLAGLILITACSVHYKGWEGWDSLKVRVAGNVFYPLSKMMGYFPGHLLSFGGKEARQVMGDWSYNALNGVYQIANSNFDYEEAMRQTRSNILSITIKKDWMASYDAAKNLYAKFSDSSKVEHLHLGPEETNVPRLNHFNWAKKPDYFVNTISEWTANNL